MQIVIGKSSKLFIITAVMIVGLILPLSAQVIEKGMKRPVNNTDLPDTIYNNGWALIIGINKYPKLPSENQLKYAVADANAIASLIESKFGFDKRNITKLEDEQATKENILKALSKFSDTNSVKENDCVFIFFSGHGQTVEIPATKGGGEMGFLIPYNADIDLSQKTNPAQYEDTCISMEELNRKCILSPAKHTIVIVDACYSGLALETTRAIETKVSTMGLKAVIASTSMQILTAGGNGEKAMELSELGHGLFTSKLISGLDKKMADENHDNIITGRELSNYIRSRVQVESNSKQNPQLGIKGEGDFLFVPQDIGELTIKVQPSDALVTAISKETSESFDFSTIKRQVITAGEYKITAKKDRYETYTDNVLVSDNETRELSISLKRESGKLRLKVDPTDAEFKITSTETLKTLNPTSSEEVELDVGEYNVVAQKSGYDSYSGKYTVTRNMTTPVDIVLKRALGRLKVIIEPFDATITVTSLDKSEKQYFTATKIIASS